MGQLCPTKVSRSLSLVLSSKTVLTKEVGREIYMGVCEKCNLCLT